MRRDDRAESITSDIDVAQMTLVIAMIHQMHLRTVWRRTYVESCS